MISNRPAATGFVIYRVAVGQRQSTEIESSVLHTEETVVRVAADAELVRAWPDDTGNTPNPPITAMRVTASDAPAAPIRA